MKKNVKRFFELGDAHLTLERVDQTGYQLNIFNPKKYEQDGNCPNVNIYIDKGYKKLEDLANWLYLQLNETE